MGNASSPINVVCFHFASFCFLHKLHTSFPHSFRHACSYPIPDVNFTFQDSTAINCLTFSVAIMISSTFRTKTCTTLVEKLTKTIKDYCKQVSFSEYFYIRQRYLGGQLYTLNRFMSSAGEQISLNCIYVLPNTKSISMINASFDPLTLFEFGIDHQALNVSRDRNPAIVLEITDAKHSAEVTSCQTLPASQPTKAVAIAL